MYHRALLATLCGTYDHCCIDITNTIATCTCNLDYTIKAIVHNVAIYPNSQSQHISNPFISNFSFCLDLCKIKYLDFIPILIAINFHNEGPYTKAVYYTVANLNPSS